MPQPPNSAAAEIQQAQEDVKRIASAFHDALVRRDWKLNGPAHVQAVVEELLKSGVIRVGRRPTMADPPMEGQTTIEEALGDCRA